MWIKLCATHAFVSIVKEERKKRYLKIYKIKNDFIVFFLNVCMLNHKTISKKNLYTTSIWKVPLLSLRSSFMCDTHVSVMIACGFSTIEMCLGFNLTWITMKSWRKSVRSDWQFASQVRALKSWLNRHVLITFHSNLFASIVFN